MKIKIAATTDVGLEREGNEDAILACPDLSRQQWDQVKTQDYLPLGPLGALLVVADGMGGAHAGEVASAIAIESLKNCFSDSNVQQVASSVDAAEDFLKKAVQQADEAICHRMAEDPCTMGMGTTIVACWILGKSALICWCGDSRCYVFNRRKGLLQLTKDHSYVQELVDKGEISEEQAFSRADNNIITQSLGDLSSAEDLRVVRYCINEGDTFMLCSDGLSGYYRNGTIEQLISNYYKDVAICCDVLLQKALEAGGYDNISIILASVIGSDEMVPKKLPLLLKLKIRLRHLF